LSQEKDFSFFYFSVKFFSFELLLVNIFVCAIFGGTFQSQRSPPQPSCSKAQCFSSKKEENGETNQSFISDAKYDEF